MMKELLAKEKEKQALLKTCGYDIFRARHFILSKSRLSAGSLLEIGTGKGHFTVVLAKKGFSVTSIDLDPAPQKLAQEYLRQKKLRQTVRILVMNAEQLKFSSHSFDNVVTVNFMHHAENPLRCLSEMARVARAKIVIADLNKKGEKILERVHEREGHAHPRSRISFSAMRTFLQGKGFFVKTYRGFCQTVLVASCGKNHCGMLQDPSKFNKNFTSSTAKKGS